jgi:hypothetical protein
MKMPGFAAEVSFNKTSTHYRTASSSSYRYGIFPAQSEVFCGVCAMGGFGCKSVCHSCGPFGWFECCDSYCTEPVMLTQ